MENAFPARTNYLELSGRVGWKRFSASHWFHLSLGENEDQAAQSRRSIDERKSGTAAGGSDLWTCDRTAHTIGTCRMGIDPGEAVVDPEGRSFDVPNLWISDNSTFPSSLAANPALAIIAVALRSADCFLRRVSA